MQMSSVIRVLKGQAQASLPQPGLLSLPPKPVRTPPASEAPPASCPWSLVSSRTGHLRSTDLTGSSCFFRSECYFVQSNKSQ